MQKKNKKVLLVDDQELTRLPIQLFLERDGRIVENACNGQEALDKFQEFSPDLVITDLRMPVMDGFTLIDHLVQISPQCPIVVISGMHETSDILHALKAGAWDYIQKPIADSKLLSHCIDKVFERYESLQLALKYQKLLTEFRGEEEKKVTTTELKEQILKANREWEGTVDLLSDYIALYDVEHRIIRINKSMARKFEINPTAAVGTQLCFFEHFTEQYSAVSTCPTMEVLATKTPYRQIFRDKYNFTYDIQIKPYFTEDNAIPTGAVFHARDISEQIESRQKQEQLYRQLMEAQKLESVGRLAAGIAHELNTPIQYLATNIDFLSEAFADIQKFIATLDSSTNQTLYAGLRILDWEYYNEEIPTTIKQSHDGIVKISSIVQAMKEFSHPGNKEMVPGDINHLIETTVTIARNEWKYDSDITLDLQPDLPAIPCLANEIGQVILNIIVNGVHAIQERISQLKDIDKGRISISTSFDDDKNLKIIISDNGIGMHEDVQKKIFDPFFTTKKLGKGTGQGLAIAYNIITHKHKGTIQVSSTYGSATSFTIILPYNAEKKELSQ